MRGKGLLTTNFAEAGAFLRSRSRGSRETSSCISSTGLVDHARRLHYGYGVSCHVAVLRPMSRGGLAACIRQPRTTPPRIDPNFLAADTR